MMGDNTEEEIGVLDEIPAMDTPIYSDKPSSVALKEFLDGDLSWDKPKDEEIV